jgi:hypothetical protein
VSTKMPSFSLRQTTRVSPTFVMKSPVDWIRIVLGSRSLSPSNADRSDFRVCSLEELRVAVVFDDSRILCSAKVCSSLAYVARPRPASKTLIAQDNSLRESHTTTSEGLALF